MNKPIENSIREAVELKIAKWVASGLGNKEGQGTRLLDEIVQLLKQEIARVGEELISGDEYPTNDMQNVNYKRTDKNKHRDELRTEQRKHLQEILKAL